MNVKAVANRLLAAVLSNRLVASVALGIFILVRRLFDTATTSDAHSVSSSKALSDSVPLPSDDVSLAPHKFLSDSVYATDDLDGNASIQDDQEMSFVKVTRERVSGITDNSVILAGKSYSDSSFGSDSGSSLKQDYVNDPFYFADDYVGTKATF